MYTGEKVRGFDSRQKGGEKGFVFNDFQVPSAEPERAGSARKGGSRALSSGHAGTAALRWARGRRGHRTG